MAWDSKIVGHGKVAPDQLLANPFNWRIHSSYQQAALTSAIDEIGFVRSVTVNRQTQHVIDGHLRVVLALRRNEPEIDVEYVDLTPEQELIALATLDSIAALAGTDAEKVREIRSGVHTADPVLDEFLTTLAAPALADVKTTEQPDKEKGPSSRDLPIDVIFTFSRIECAVWLATTAGFKYGIQSAKVQDLAIYTFMSARRTPIFVDNDYFNYDHAVHLDVVKQIRPKYATVRDIMTHQQCVEAGIPYYSLSQILEWAEELQLYAENVILIPKYDCFDKIPDRYMLGYSVPSSHGGTPLPIDAFRGRRIHLLGGSWKRQLSYLQAAGEDVVSLDNNHVHKIASYGRVATLDGDEVDLKTILPPTIRVNNPLYVALALSFGAMATKINALYGHQVVPATTLDSEGSDTDDAEYSR